MEFNRLHNFVNNYFEIIHQYLPNITKSEMQTIILYNRENYGTAIEFINNIKDYIIKYRKICPTISDYRIFSCGSASVKVQNRFWNELYPDKFNEYKRKYPFVSDEDIIFALHIPSTFRMKRFLKMYNHE